MLKKLLLALLVLALAAGGVVFYLAQQATELPDWYEPEKEKPPDWYEPAEQTPDKLAAVPLPPPLPARAVPATGLDPPPSADGRRELKLDARQLDELVERSLDARPDGRRARRATKVIHAALAGDRLRISAVTDLDRLLAAAENEKERAAIAKLTRLVPWIRGRDFHFAIEGRPRAAGGELALDDVSVMVGHLSFEPLELLQAFGLEDGQGQLAVRLPDMELANARVENEMLWLSLAPGPR